MAEIKFRAWHEESKEYVYFDNVKASTDIYISKHFFELAESGKLEQFTGLKDKFGGEIYEGDIVNGYWWICGEKVFHDFLVEWCCDSYRLTIVNHNSRWGFSDVHGIEIIGNIHKNKDLLQCGL